MSVIRVHFPDSDGYFAGHFPSAPLVPAVVILDRFERGLLAEYEKRIVSWNRSKFTAAVLPNQTIDYHFEISGRKLTLAAAVEGVRVCEAVAGLL